MAKQDIKEYIEGRLDSLLEGNDEYINFTPQEVARVEEVLRMASHFQIKTKDALKAHPGGKFFKK